MMNGFTAATAANDFFGTSSNGAAAAASQHATAPTYFITDRRMLSHKCEWDPDHIERPERLEAVLDVLEKEHVLDRCQMLEPAECTYADLALAHSAELIEQICQASSLPSIDQMEDFCKGYEDIYINKYSWESACLAAGCALKAMEAVLQNARSRLGYPAPNAFAAIRPPGHHASRDASCGFCLFNNVAVCAKKARSMGVKRVLILDWDIHAGQGTQYCIDDDPGIILISAHRYENGQYWPELPESDVVHEYPNTINVPLNELGCGDAEYAAFMHFLVLPFIEHWQPELILVSCGFDAALGDPQGEMEITPAGFGYMAGLVAQLGIPTCLLLEGGYFLGSVVQGALSCVRALLQRSPPVRNFCQRIPSPGFLRILYTSLMTKTKDVPLFDQFMDKLNTLRQWVIHPGSSAERQMPRTLSAITLPEEKLYFGNRKILEFAMAHHLYPTRGQYPPREPAVEHSFELRLQQALDQNAKGPIERATVNFEFDKRGNVLLISSSPTSVLRMRTCLENGNGNVGGMKKVLLFSIRTQYQFFIFYYCFLLPMNFTFFNVHLSNMPLPLDANRLSQLVAKFDIEEYEEEMEQQQQQHQQNHHEVSGNNNGKQQLDLKKCLKIFPQMKPLYLF